MRYLLRYLGQRLYTIWATFWFIVPFVATFPVQWLASKWDKARFLLPLINHGWARFSIMMWGLPVEVVRAAPGPDPKPAVYVANHSSYIDIMVMFKVIPPFLNMMGKVSLTKVPLWGPIFGSLYITVDRSSAVSRGRAMVAARRTLAAGNSLTIFPEGRISPTPGRALLPFHDGAFQLAIETGVPLIPVSMPLNHRFLPDGVGLRVRHHRLKVVMHAPISTTGLTLADIPALKQRVEALIASDFLPEGAEIPEASTWRKPN